MLTRLLKKSPSNRTRNRRRMGVEVMEERRLLALGDFVASIYPESTREQVVSRVALSDDYRVVVNAGARVPNLGAVGAVTVYNSSNELVAQLTPTDESAEEFGSHVQIDGDRILVTDPDHDDRERVYVFDMSSATPTEPILVASNPSGPRPSSRFVNAHISGDRIAIGWKSDDPRLVTVFDLSSATPQIPIATLSAPTIPGTTVVGFGFRVQTQNDLVFVQANQRATGDPLFTPTTFVFDLTSASPEIPVDAIEGDLFFWSDSRYTVEDPNTGVVDIFDLLSATPDVPLASVDVNGDFTRLAGDYYAVENTTTGLTDIFDLGTPVPRSPVASIDIPGGFGFGTIHDWDGDRFLAVDDSDRSDVALRVYDVSSTTPEVAVASFQRSFIRGDRFQIDGDTVMASSFLLGPAFVFDLSLSDPAAQATELYLGLPAADEGFGEIIAANDQYLAVAGAVSQGNDAYIRVYDLTTDSRSTPTVLSNLFSERGSLEDIEVVGSWVVVATTNEEILLYDMSSASPGTPVHVIQKNRFRDVDLASNDGHLFVGGFSVIDDDSLRVFDLNSSTPTSPIAEIAFSAGSPDFDPMAVSDELLITTLADTVAVYSIQDAILSGSDSGPHQILGQGLSTFRKTLAISNDYIIVGMFSDDTVRVYDGQNRPHSLIGTIDLGAGTPRMEVAGDYLFVGNPGSDDVQVFDLSSATPDVPIASLTNPVTQAFPEYSAFGSRVVTTNDLIFVSDRGDSTENLRQGAVHVFDLANDAPDITPIDEQSAVVDAEFNLTLTFTDPDPADTHTVNIDWGDGTIETIDPALSALNVSHTYAAEDTFTATVTVTDQHGASDSETFDIDVVEVTDPVQVINGELIVTGAGNAPERIVITTSGAPGNLRVRIGNTFYGPFSADRATINAGAGNDTIIYNGGVPVIIDGGLGNDYIAGTPYDDILLGGPGNDIILAGEGDNTVDGGEGNDRIEARSGNDLLLGGPGNDRINGGDGSDTLDGGDGNDQLFGGLGDDLLLGGIGLDLLYGSWGNDALIGGDHRDVLNGQNGHDVLIGGNGSDNLRGGSGDDLLMGDATSFDFDQAALLAILAEWAGAGSRDMQAATLLGASVVDGAIDELNGESGVDYYVPIGSDSVRFRSGEDVRIP